MNRTAAIRLAASLPKGDPRRRKILSRLRKEGLARWEYDSAHDALEAALTKAGLDGHDIRSALIRWESQVTDAIYKRIPTEKIVAWILSARAGTADYRRGIKAALKDGPAGRVLDKFWNTLHDFEYQLERAIKDYDDAESYSGGPAQRDAYAMVQALDKLVASVNSMSEQMGDVADQEAAFIKRHGPPAEYVIKQRNQMFPR
jgi:hypothetical protein